MNLTCCTLKAIIAAAPYIPIFISCLVFNFGKINLHVYASSELFSREKWCADENSHVIFVFLLLETVFASILCLLPFWYRSSLLIFSIYSHQVFSGYFLLSFFFNVKAYFVSGRRVFENTLSAQLVRGGRPQKRFHSSGSNLLDVPASNAPLLLLFSRLNRTFAARNYFR